MYENNFSEFLEDIGKNLDIEQEDIIEDEDINESEDEDIIEQEEVIVSNKVKSNFYLTTKQVSELKNKIEAFNTLFPELRISGVYFEHILYDVLKNDKPTNWDIYSHKSGMDIKYGGVNISCKSGRLKKGYISYSSYRSGKYKELNDKIKFFNERFYDVVLIIVLDGYTYKIYKKDFVYNELPYQNLKTNEPWIDKGSTIKYVGKNIAAVIKKSLSYQLWVSYPENKLEKIFEYTLQKR